MNSLILETFQKEKLDLLLRLIGQINSDLDINNVLLNIIDASKVITDSEACSVFLIDNHTNDLILSIPSGPAGEAIAGMRLPVGEGIAGWVAAQAEPQIVNDVRSDERFRGDFDPQLFTTRNILCAPLLNQSQEVIGVLQAINKENGENYSSDELPLFQALANQAAIAITNARMHEERTTLLAEIHHRVKNNMAVVSSLIQMQAMMEEDECVQGKLLMNVARISSIATVHEQLYKSDSFSRLNFAENVKQMTAGSFSSLNASDNVKLTFRCDHSELSINQSIPCSLIINEVIIHLVKHGYKPAGESEFILELKESDDHSAVYLTIKHNGRSIRDRIAGKNHSEAGFHLIGVLSGQLEADYNYTEGENLHEFSLSFQKTDKKGGGNGHL
jgi:two-component sensor histidine kinase